METQIFLDEASLVIGAYHTTLIDEAVETLTANGLEVNESDMKILEKYFDVVVESAIDGMIPEEAEFALDESDLCLVEGHVYLKDGLDLDYICEEAAIHEMVEASGEVLGESTDVEAEVEVEVEVEAQTTLAESDLDSILDALDLTGGQ